MKKIILLVILLLTNTIIYAASFTVFGKVYNEDGSKGTSLTANSYCGLKTYRKSIPVEIGVQNIGPNNICPQKIFPTDYDGKDTPAYFNSDVGSYNWSTVVDVGQYVITVVEVYNEQFPLCLWSGPSYVGARIKVLSQADIDNGGIDMPDTRLESIPAPQPQTILTDAVVLTWTGLSYDPDNLITGYTVYRSTEPGGTGGYEQLTATAQHIKAGLVSYTDINLVQGKTYYYKIAVNFEWGGGNGAPDYFMSNAKSYASNGIYIGETPTSTLTMTFTPYFTETNTYTLTETPTLTLTLTETQTPTETATDTYTITLTDTETVTSTDTYTPTFTFTPTCSITLTSTETSTPTYTATFTLTPTPTTTPTITSTTHSQIAGFLKQRLLKERIVVLNNPVKDGVLRVALYNENNGIVKISLYNINGELVMKMERNINSGFTILQDKITKANGVYILKTIIKTDNDIINLPLKKVGVIK